MDFFYGFKEFRLVDIWKKEGVYFTTTFPTIVGCSWQKYGNSPAVMNLWENVFPWVVKAVGPDKPESNSFPWVVSLGPVPEVTVWKTVSLLVQVTVSPTLAFSGFGAKALSAKVDALGTIETLLPPVELVEVVLLLLVILALCWADTKA
jgi:hypothetical protein